MKKLLFFTFLLIILSVLESNAQCAMCRATVASGLSDGRGTIGTGINMGILYMLLMPYILVGVLIYLWRSRGKKELKERLELEEQLRTIYSNKL